MTTGERLVDISTLTSDTAMQHFLNIEVGVGGGLVNVTYVVRTPVKGIVNKITTITGELQFIKQQIGVVKKITVVSGKLQVIKPVSGGLKTKSNIKGDIKCQ